MTGADLQIQYEDALFALMMADISKIVEHDAWTEHRRLKQEVSATVPPDIHQSCLLTVRQKFKKQRHHRTRRIALKTLGRVAILIGILSILFLAVLATSDQVREKFFNSATYTNASNTTFYVEFSDTSDFSTGGVPSFTLGWMPEGYVLEQESEYISGCSAFYENPDVGVLFISCLSSMGTVLSMDTEDAEIEEVVIGGTTGIMATKMIGEVEERHLVWLTEDGTAFISVLATEMDKEDFLQIVMNLEYGS